jgi:TolB-like protein/tetratricopeptide (TPR) repeat protein/DNA-binding winged helix-turn-helix (wHTH) protein
VSAVRERLLGGFYLGEYFIEPATGRVSGSAPPQHLPSKAVEVLLCLASNPLSLISRDELLRSVWGEGSGSHEALRHAIGDLRRVFNDHLHDPRYIQTLPKRGYRLLQTPRFAEDPAVRPGGIQASADLIDLFGELTRRGVIETGLAYLVVGWLLIQVADATFEHLGLPYWAGAFVTFLVIGGFPIALALAWFMEIADKRPVVDLDGDRPKKKAFSKTYMAVVGALALASIVVFVYDRLVGLPPPATNGDAILGHDAIEAGVDPNSIAVLPLRNIDGSEQTAVFSNGLIEDVINQLARIPGLRVSARGDSSSLPVNASSSQVRQRLRVAYYIDGSVRLTEEQIRVVIHLIESATGRSLLSRSFDREHAEFFEIQDEITHLAVANLRVALPDDRHHDVGDVVDAANIDAYISYRRGMEALHKPVTIYTVKEALDWFAQSLEIDPEYAAAHAGICLAYSSGFKEVDDPNYIDEAERACASALALNPNLTVVYSALGDLYLETGRHQEAKASYLRALAINQNDAPSRIGLAGVHAAQHRLADAEQELKQAIALQPGNWRFYNELGRFLYHNGRYEEAAATFQEIVALDAENTQGWGNLGTALMLSGNFFDAIPAFRRAIEIEPHVDWYANLGLIYYYQGDMDAAVAALEAGTQLARDDHLGWSNLGDALSFSKEPNRAGEAFRRAEELAETLLAVNSRDAQTTMDLAWIKAMLGKTEDAKNLIARARRLAPSDPHVYYIHGLILTRLGEHAAALSELEMAVERGYPVVMLAAEPHLEELRGEERFAALTARRNGD